jgi:cell division protein FtsB
VLAVILVFAMLFTMCGREIFRLKARNYALKKQQEELKEERDRLAKELEKVGDKEYIKDQARKQLRLLDPGEIMFVFEEDGKEAASEAEGAAETEGKSTD